MPGAAAAVLTLGCAVSACGDQDDAGSARSVTSAAVTRPGPVSVAAPVVPGARSARTACSGATPAEIRTRFLPTALARSSRRERPLLKAAARALGSDVAQPFVAARIYAMSVSKSHRAGAYAGCAYELSMKSQEGSRR
jgi:hypothetical protein